MCTLYDNLLKLCKEKGVSGARMCTDIGVSKSLMTGLKMGRRSSISMDTAQKIADYFGVSVDRVLGTEQKEKPTAVSGSELSKKGKEIGMAYDAAVQEVRARMEAAAFGRAPSHAVAKIEMVCSLGYGKQTIYQPVYCVAGKAMPFNPNNGCEHYHACPECEICRANAILKSFECDPLDCDLL